MMIARQRVAVTSLALACMLAAALLLMKFVIAMAWLGRAAPRDFH